MLKSSKWYPLMICTLYSKKKTFVTKPFCQFSKRTDPLEHRQIFLWNKYRIYFTRVLVYAIVARFQSLAYFFWRWCDVPTLNQLHFVFLMVVMLCSCQLEWTELLVTYNARDVIYLNNHTLIIALSSIILPLIVICDCRPSFEVITASRQMWSSSCQSGQSVL